MNSEESKLLISYFYVSKELKKNPTKAIYYIMENRQLFKFVTDEWLNQIKKEHSVTDEDLEKIAKSTNKKN